MSKKSSKTETESTNQTAELKNQLARALADYANLQKRVEEERRVYIEMATLKVMTDLLPIVDNLEKAYQITQDQGVGMVLKQMKDILAAVGLREIEEREEFDPHFHEAIASVEGHREGEIVEQVEKGYTHNGRVVKAAKVVVGKKAEKDDQSR